GGRGNQGGHAHQPARADHDHGARRRRRLHRHRHLDAPHSDEQLGPVGTLLSQESQLMRTRSVSERRIFFPWEGRGGLRRYFAFGRIRPLIYAATLLAVLGVIAVRERRDSGIRQTRATLLDMRRAVDTYIADHEGGCPDSLEAARTYARIEEAPRDAWGHPL